jgi:hypothetical protein
MAPNHWVFEAILMFVVVFCTAASLLGLSGAEVNVVVPRRPMCAKA